MNQLVVNYDPSWSQNLARFGKDLAGLSLAGPGLAGSGRVHKFRPRNLVFQASETLSECSQGLDELSVH